MYYNENLLITCYEVWRLGYKREKALQYCADKLGYKPLEPIYVEHFKKMYDDAFKEKTLCLNLDKS